MATPPPIIAPPSLPSAASSPQLTPEHFGQLQAAGVAMMAVRRMTLIAQFDGWSVGVLGGLTFFVALVSLLAGSVDLPSMALGAVMIGVAFVELRTAGRLKRLDADAPSVLGFNQIVFGTALAIYALWKLGSGVGDRYTSEIAANPELAEMLVPIQDMTRMVYTAVYVTLIVIAVFCQGGLALYYFTRSKLMRSYIEKTPEWIQTMQRAGVSV